MKRLSTDKIAVIKKFITDAEKALTHPAVLANEADGSNILSEAIMESIAEAKQQLGLDTATIVCQGKPLRLEPLPRLVFDYRHQAWVEDGKYMGCNHPASIDCGCFARDHAGEILSAAQVHRLQIAEAENKAYIAEMEAHGTHLQRLV